MTVQRKSDQSQRQSSQERKKQRSVRRLAVGAMIVCLLAGIVIYALNFHAVPAPQSTDPGVASRNVETAVPDPELRWQQSKFVGRQACAKCHADIAETYSDHPMANTLASVADASPIEVVENNSTEFETQGCRYRVERRGDRMIHTEFMTDASGRLVYERPVEVQYAVGSGMNARTYLIDRGGILFESPITWYTEKQKWDLSPGYHDNPRQGFNRRVKDGCVQCHSGRSAPAGNGTSDRFEKQPFLELGIGCERCHGPGKRHVERMEADVLDVDDETAQDRLIVNPARLDRRLEESVCHQCHMGGKARILRKGKSWHDFRPGMATEDIWTVFVSPTLFAKDGSPRLTSHVEQMRFSACFQGTDGNMRCTTCHDPHRSPQPDERAAFYRARCNSCHNDHGCSLPIEEREAPPALNSCMHCHMPKFGSSDIPHTSGSDHRVLRTPRTAPDVVDDSQQRAIWSIFDDSDERMPEWEVRRARALALSDQAIFETQPELIGPAIEAIEAALTHDANDVEALRRLGFLYGAVRNDAKAGRSFEAALRIDPHHEMSLMNLGMLELQTGSFTAASRRFERYLEVNAWDPTIYSPYAAALARTGDLPAAVQAAERGLQLDPTQRDLRSLAVQLYERIGDRQKSQQHRKTLRKIGSQLDPWDQKREDRNRKSMETSQ